VTAASGWKCRKTAIWSSKTNRNKGASLVLQDDGNLVVYSTDNKALWNTNTKSKDEPAPTPTPAPAAAATAEPATSASTKAANAPAAPVIKPAVAANAGTTAAATKATAKAANSRSYTVVKGDSLWKIAEKIYGKGTDFKKIAKANHISNPDHIRPGQQLVIPE
jgi:nucleoid-associated protein YgaU